MAQRNPRRLYVSDKTWAAVKQLSERFKIPLHRTDSDSGLVDTLLKFAIDTYEIYLGQATGTGPIALLNLRRERISHSKDHYVTLSRLRDLTGRPYMTVHDKVIRAIETGLITEYAIHDNGRIFVDPEQGEAALARRWNRKSDWIKDGTSQLTKHRTGNAGGRNRRSPRRENLGSDEG